MQPSLKVIILVFATVVSGSVSSRLEAADTARCNMQWDSLKNSNNEQTLRAFITSCSQHSKAHIARERLKNLEGSRNDSQKISKNQTISAFPLEQGWFSKYQHSGINDNDVATKIRFSTDGKLVIASFGSDLVSWSIQNSRKTVLFKNKSISDFSISPDGKSVAVAASTGAVSIISINKGTIEGSIDTPEGLPLRVRYHPNGTLFIADGKAVIIMNTSDKKIIGPTFSAGTTIVSIALSPSGNLLLAKDSEGILRLWDTNTGLLRWTIQEKVEDSYFDDKIKFSSDGKNIVTGYNNGDVTVFDILKPTNSITFKGADSQFYDAIDIPSRNMLISVHYGRKLYYWNRSTGALLKIRKAGPYIQSVEISPDENHIALGTWDEAIYFWSTAALLAK